MSEINNSSHKSILKSTGIIGFSQVIIILISLIRTKVVAIFFGTIGVGYVGLFQSIIDLVKSVTSFGISFSGVKNISEANNSGNKKNLDKTIRILKRWVRFTGGNGTLIMFIFSKELSKYTFGNYTHSLDIKILSVSLIIGALAGGELTILQALRRVSSTAKVNIYSALIGFIISVPIYYIFGVSGIVSVLLLNSIVSLILSFWYTKDIRIENEKISILNTYKGGLDMLKLGLFTVITGFATTGTMYLVRIFIANKSGIEEVGLYQAAWTLSSLYLSLILNGMITDYFPALSAINKDNKKVNELVNQQSYIALLLSIPLIVGILVFLPLIIQTIFTSDFIKMLPLLQWQIVGTLFRVIAWPLGIILLAKAKGKILIVTELSFNVLYFAIIYFGWGKFGIEITGISFLIGYIFYLIIVYLFVQPLCKFRWTKNNVKILILSILLVSLTLLIVKNLSGIWMYIIGSIILIITSLLSYNKLNEIIQIKEMLSKFKNKIRPN